MREPFAPRAAGAPGAGTVPPGWPQEVRPPEAPGWQRSATEWLFDLSPAGYRSHEVLRRHPVVLARFAAAHVTATVAAVRAGLGTARADLRDVVAPDVVDAAVAAYERELVRLTATARAVDVVEKALRGHRFRPRL